MSYSRNLFYPITRRYYGISTISNFQSQSVAFLVAPCSIPAYQFMLGRIGGTEMPKVASELNGRQVRDLRKVGLHAVGGVAGLHLQVTPSGARSWILRTKVGSRRPDIGLGGFPEVTLAQAREKAREAKDKIRQGIDPVAERQALRAALIAAQATQLTFGEAAKRCHATRSAEFKNRKHAAQWINTLETYAFPTLGQLPIADIELPHVLKVLEPIWHEKTETATRVRQRIEAVITWATVSGYRSGDNPARWLGNLKEVLPAPRKIAKVTHHKALPYSEVPAFMPTLRERSGMAARALEFAILTASRSEEVRHATWDEIDLDAALWTIPGERMKAGKPHRVPLSDTAISLLRALPTFPGCDVVFASVRGKPLSDNTLSKLLRDMKVPAVPHGFRSSFKDWARSCTRYADEVSELALAHVNDDATRAAYARDELLPKRQRMMAEWAKYLDKPAARTGVTAIREAAQ